ncbi:hypothetical protein CRG98_012244 [Punica granatum]|uniref:Uncharacterized protein n=1 Tax=Punica granatum TaxID=22663 RepID=A0A2I0KFT8_PUNGR|nr:hypothetical protein CRG98_012244 [Punica granatum]
MLYGRTSITLKDVNASLNLKELQKNVIGYQGNDGEGLIPTGKSTKEWSHCGCKSRHQKRTCWICDKECHLKRDRQRRKVKALTNIEVTERSSEGGDILSVAADRGTRSLTTSGRPRSLDILGYKYMGGPSGVLKVSKGALLCRSGSRGRVEKPVKKVEFVVKDPETLKTQPIKIKWKVLLVQHGLNGALSGEALTVVIQATTNEMEPLSAVAKQEAHGCVHIF